MRTLISAVKTLAVATAMFAFASGAWADHEGDGIEHDIDEVLEVDAGGEAPEDGVTGVEVELVSDPGDAVSGGEPVGEETPLENGAGEEIYYTMVDDGAVDAGVDGETGVTAVVDGDGNFIYVVTGGDAGMGESDMEMIPLMSATGASNVIAVSDTTADQAGIDAAVAVELDTSGGQPSFAMPVDVATANADAGAAPGVRGGIATRISGGHLSAPGGH